MVALSSRKHALSAMMFLALCRTISRYLVNVCEAPPESPERSRAHFYALWAQRWPSWGALTEEWGGSCPPGMEATDSSVHKQQPVHLSLSLAYLRQPSRLQWGAWPCEGSGAAWQARDPGQLMAAEISASWGPSYHMWVNDEKHCHSLLWFLQALSENLNLVSGYNFDIRELEQLIQSLCVQCVGSH